LDSDNTPTKDPSFLFDTDIYKTYGALFWPDFWKTAKENKIFDLLQVKCQDGWEQEVDMIILDVYIYKKNLIQKKKYSLVKL
jgi:hypothetical protein